MAPPSQTELEARVRAAAQAARQAAAPLSELSRATKDDWLLRCVDRLAAARDAILAANGRDLAAAEAKGIAAPLVRRLDLSGDRWKAMLAGLGEVAALPDPVGEVTELRVRPNGLRVGRMRIPLGVIGIIYESRPNVTVDAAALCVKAGNAVILRGGSEAICTNVALAAELRAAARDVNLPEAAVTVIDTTDRAAIDVLLQLDGDIDLIIPRGGPSLIQKVVATSRIPVIRHDAGVCHIFLDESADTEMASAVVCDSKLRQMAVCNGLETLLVHRDGAARLLPEVLKVLHEAGVELRGCPETREIFSEAIPVVDEDWPTEYLAPILAVRVVPDLDAAIDHIRRYGSNHTDVIVTESYTNSQRFVRSVQSSTVGVNCSTAFADGHRLGLGAEIGISTSKLHAFGPMGLEELTTRKFVLFGEGQLRE